MRLGCLGWGRSGAHTFRREVDAANLSKAGQQVAHFGGFHERRDAADVNLRAGDQRATGDIWWRIVLPTTWQVRSPILCAAPWPRKRPICRVATRSRYPPALLAWTQLSPPPRYRASAVTRPTPFQTGAVAFSPSARVFVPFPRRIDSTVPVCCLGGEHAPKRVPAPFQG